MKRVTTKIIVALSLAMSLSLGAYTIKICYNGSQDPTDTNVPQNITLHTHAQGGACWADNFTISVPLYDAKLNNFTHHDVTPRAGNWNCVMVPETINGQSIRPWQSGAWPNIKPIGEGQTWQIFKTKDPQIIQTIRRPDPLTRKMLEQPIGISWFAIIQDGLQDCQAPLTQTLPTKKSEEPVKPVKDERRVKAAGILPYCIDPETKQIKLLIAKGPTKHTCVLGLFNCSMDKWADFGGSVEEKDYAHHKGNKDEAIKETAARETHEETMGFFSRTLGKDQRSKEETEKGIKFWTEKLKEENRVKTKAGYDYWFAEIPCTSTQTTELRELHNIMYAKASWTSSISTPWFGDAYFLWKIDSDIEKSDFRWVPADTILEQLEATASTNAPLKIKDPEDPTQTLDLYYRFEKSLREGQDVLKKINGPIKKFAQAERQKAFEEGMKQLSPQEKQAFTDMMANVNDIKKNLTSLLEQYKNALANKNNESAQETAQEISNQLAAVKQLLAKMNEAMEKNTALGKLIKDRLTPEIEKTLKAKAEDNPGLIKRGLQYLLYGIVWSVDKTVDLLKLPAAYLLYTHQDVIQDEQQAIVVSAGVFGVLGMLKGLVYMLQPGPQLSETPEQVLAPFQLEIAQAAQAEQTIIKTLETEKKTGIR